MTIVLLGVGGLFLLLVLLLLAFGGKKDHINGGKKAFVAIFTIIGGVALLISPLVHANIIPLNLRVGYYIEVNDVDNNGKIGGYKITMDTGVSYYEDFDINHLDQKKTEKGEYRLEGTHLFMEFPTIGAREYQIDGFINTKLTVAGKTAYTFVTGIGLNIKLG